MEPLSVIAAATALARITGMDRYIGDKLGGEKGAEIATRVVDAASALTGQTSPTAVLESIQGDPALAHELRLRLLDMETKEAERILADRMDARDMQKVALQQEDLFSKRFIFYFAAAWSLFTMAYIVLITMVPLGDNNQRFADTILGFMLGTLIATILNFFYGSNRQSQTKDTTLEALSSLLRKGQ